MVKKGKNKTELEFDFNKDLFVQFIKSDDNLDYTDIASVPDKVVPMAEYIKDDFDVQNWYLSPSSKENSIYHGFIKKQIEELSKIQHKPIYSPEHQTILKKYSEQPKTIKNNLFIF